jgi:hypothetical protein
MRAQRSLRYGGILIEAANLEIAPVMDILGVPNMRPGWLCAAAPNQVRARRSFSLLVNHSPLRQCDPLPNQALLDQGGACGAAGPACAGLTGQSRAHRTRAGGCTRPSFPGDGVSCSQPPPQWPPLRAVARDRLSPTIDRAATHAGIGACGERTCAVCHQSCRCMASTSSLDTDAARRPGITATIGLGAWS